MKNKISEKINWGLVLGGRKGYENWDNPKNLTFLDRTRPQ